MSTIPALRATQYPERRAVSAMGVGAGKWASCVSSTGGALRWMPCAMGLLGALWMTSVGAFAEGDSATAAADAASQSTVQASAPVANTYPFDFSAQALASALEQYGEASGRPVVFDSSLVAGRMSAPLHGRYTSEAALRILLDGTGLSADYSEAGNSDAFVLTPDADASSAAGATPPVRSAVRDP